MLNPMETTLSRFGKPVAELSPEQRVLFYELFAHELAIGFRNIWTNKELSLQEQIEQMKWINEIMHRVVRKITYEREQTHKWLDTDMENLVAGAIKQQPGIRTIVNRAINASYKYAIGLS